MPRTRKRAPSTPKKTPKRPRTAKNQGTQRELPGGALEMSFQVEVAPPDALQAEVAPHVHFASDAPPAAPGSTAGPSGHHGDEGDFFLSSTPVQLPNQGGFCSPPDETFNLHNVSDGSQEGDAGATVGKKLPADLLCGFDVDEDGKRVCTFCVALQEDNSTARVHHYSETTATGTLRTHLLNNHLEEWVGKCQKNKIQLKGKEGEEALAKFTGVPLQHQAKARVAFSQEAFLDGLVQFIV
ncbi:hypothetical protein V8E53_010332, partial [Lactarius tabidus]